MSMAAEVDGKEPMTDGGRAAGGGATPPLLVVEKLSIELGPPGKRARVVDEISFVINEGEVLSLAGESGSGKTMTALAIVGLLPQGATVTGSIRFCGQELVNCSATQIRTVRGGGVGIIFQEPMTSLHPSKRVGTQVAEVFKVQEGSRRKRAWSQAVEMLEMAGIPHAAERAHQYPHELSGGLQQRVAIAIALAGHPSLIIADEPTTALDTTVQAQVMERLRVLREELNVAVLFISHDLAIISELSDRIAVMYSGRVIEEGLIHDIYTRPEHPYTEMLLSAVLGDGVLKEPKPAATSVRPGQGCAFYPRCPHGIEACIESQPPPEHRLTDGSVRCIRHTDLNLSGVHGTEE